LDKTAEQISGLEIDLSKPEVWQDREKVKVGSLKLKVLNDKLSAWKKLKSEADDLLEIAKLDEGDQSISLREEAEVKLKELEKKFSEMEFQVLFSGKYDEHNAILAIHAGAGGVDAMDWAEMLLRMYLRYAEKRGFKTRILDESRGGEAGIKSITLKIQGPYTYGYFKSEHGVHRLVRISPFDAEKMRHTSFALVEVLPELGELEEKEIIINPDDLRIDTYLASGHGGQSVQTTYSAVRIVHLPTKITVTCQNERSQAQNKETALKILKAKLFQVYEEKRLKEKEKLRGEYKSAEWGSQIRSYVLHPYHQVKDLRSGYETNNPDKVLNGELDELVESYLKRRE
jgi:peptide chain release factor 2